MILLMVSTGVRIGALDDMQIGDLTEIKFQGMKIYKIEVYAMARERYFTSCTHKCYSRII